MGCMLKSGWAGYSNATLTKGCADKAVLASLPEQCNVVARTCIAACTVMMMGRVRWDGMVWSGMGWDGMRLQDQMWDA